MFKNIVIIIVLSLLAILFLSEVHYLLNFLVFAYNKVNHFLGLYLPNTSTVRLITATLSLIIVPVIIGLVIHLIIWLISRRGFNHLWMCIWFVWLLLLALLH